MAENDIEMMTEERLDQELRSYGLDPEQVVQNAFSKLCIVLQQKSAELLAAKTRIRELERPYVFSDGIEPPPQQLGEAYDKARSRVRELEQALHKYGVHDRGCIGWSRPNKPSVNYCNCGLEAALHVTDKAAHNER